MNINFLDKLVVITGANSGIGLQILREYANLGADIIAITRNIETNFKSECDELQARNGISIKNIEVDFQDLQNVYRVGTAIAKNKKNIDILVNNAGVAAGGLFTQTKIETIKDVFEVNFFSPLLLTQYVLKNMIKNNSGVILNIASTSGIKPRSGMSAYGTSKTALIFWSKILAREVGSFGIRVNAIAPGITNTKMLNQMSAKFTDRILQDTPLESFASPANIAALAIYLSSDYASHITGEIINCDGGEVS